MNWRWFNLGYQCGYDDAPLGEAADANVYKRWEQANRLTPQKFYGGVDFNSFYRGYTTGMKIARTPMLLRWLRCRCLRLSEGIAGPC